MSLSHEHWLGQAIQIANENVAVGGGPFAAIVVKEGEIVGKGVNEIHLQHDPTAHAELLALREACIRLGRADLSDCILYASGEPCPMCMGAIYWARPQAIYYACSKLEASSACDFPDPLSDYERQLNLPPHEREIPLYKIEHKDKLKPFQSWRSSLG